MAVQYANGKIVTNGLVLALDAGDRNSYTGSGTSWTDLSGNGNTGTLTNGPTYSSTNGGSIVFDGSNDYIDLGNKTLGVELQDKSACVWIYQTTSPSVFAGIIDKDFDNNPVYGGWGFWISSANKMNFWLQGQKDLIDTGSGTITNNTWQHLSFSYNYSAKSVSFYLNGILNSTVTNATIVENASDTTTLKIGAFRGGTSLFNGRISNVLLYNKQLTAAEVLQNYNAQKARFNIK
jgi:hypothetical protein